MRIHANETIVRGVVRPPAHGVGLILALAAILAAGGQPALADSSDASTQTGNNETDTRNELELLRQLVEELSQANEKQVRELLARIAELEAKLAAMEAEQQDGELDQLLAEAEELAAEEAEKEKEAEAQRETFVGRQRTLQALNPEISFLGDFSYDWADGPIKDGFLVRGVEIAFQAPLDPYTRFKAFLAGHQEPFEMHLHEEEVPEAKQEEEEEHGHGHGESEIGVSIEEAYMEWVALPTNMRLYVGKFRQQYGTLNRWHPHALASVDMPFALQRLFGHDGLVGLGAGVSWQLPSAWASSNSLTLEVTNADNPNAFAGSDWNDPAFLLRHTGFFDLGPDAYFEVGLNASRAPNDEEGEHDTTLAGIDFNFLWEPVNRARYRGFELRGEWIHSRFEAEDTDPVAADSFYTYLSWKLNRRWSVGVRYDDVEVPFDRFELFDPDTLEPIAFREGLKERAWSPFLTWWQSEFVRLRLQYQQAKRDFAAHWGGDDDDRFWLQVTFAAGPHKHESY